MHGVWKVQGQYDENNPSPESAFKLKSPCLLCRVHVRVAACAAAGTGGESQDNGAITFTYAARLQTLAWARGAPRQPSHHAQCTTNHRSHSYGLMYMLPWHPDPLQSGHAHAAQRPLDSSAA